MVVSRESNDQGLSFGPEVVLSAPTTAPRFMPWSCSSMGTVFAGWYDRTAAVTGATDDLTDYLVGSPIFASPLKLTGPPDPQCASGWPSGPISQDDANSCTVQPQCAGVCLNGNKTGSNNKCDFKGGICPTGASCPAGESCQTDGGQPKYGDYNGITCLSDRVIAAWASATAPTGLPSTKGITIFTSVIPLTGFATPTYDELGINITTGDDNVMASSEVTANIPGQGNFCLKPSSSNSPDGICANGSGAPGWNNGDVVSQTFALPAPLSPPTSITITLVQGTCGGCTSDNWNIEDISVTAMDHTHSLPPLPLLNLSGSTPVNDNQSCVARLKEANDNAASAMFSLASPPTNTHTYVGGKKSNGKVTTCQNNGG